MFSFNGRAKYVHEHTSALPFLHTNHNRSLVAEQGLTPHTRNKCTYYTLSYPPGSILSDTNYYIALYVFLVVSMATNVVLHLTIISILGGFYRKWISLVR